MVSLLEYNPRPKYSETPKLHRKKSIPNLCAVSDVDRGDWMFLKTTNNFIPRELSFIGILSWLLEDGFH